MLFRLDGKPLAERMFIARPLKTSLSVRRNWIERSLLLAVIAVALAAASCRNNRAPAQSGGLGAQQHAAKFVGSRTCAECHQQEFKLWTGSHHQLAMQPAGEGTVLGNFNNAIVTNEGVVSKFFRRGGYFVRTQGPEGKFGDYQIQYTFGYSPLQQYLIALPGGRLQALSIAWDSRPRSQGGQRWFDLYAGQKIAPGDPLHWTGLDQNWNYMCADCHSTNVRKNYDFKTRTYATAYSEIDVACEACHGPGSLHTAWARGRAQVKAEGLTIILHEHRDAVWRIDEATGNARRSTPRTSTREIEMCARCHSRRSLIHEDFVHGQPLGDDYRVALLDAGLYFPDGQIKAEDYEYGSFIQSRMFHAGVTCSDCHDPHSLKLRAAGNQLCLRCHAARKYDAPSHHFHRTGSPGARCVECHMPARLYMVIDARRDHSIRIPRPGLSVSLGVPNACNNCHTDKTPQWAAAMVRQWHGRTGEGYQRFAQALARSMAGAPDSRELLTALIADPAQPAIARATALVRLAGLPGPQLLQAGRESVGDGDALVRRAAAEALSEADPAQSAPILLPLLNDSVRSVRLEAAQSLAGAPLDTLGAAGENALRRAVAEYAATQQLNADRPEAHLDLANLLVREKQFDQAQAQLRDALSLEPSFAPGAVNLADLYRATGRDADGERVLRAAILRSPGDGSLQYALGLLLVRLGRKDEAIGHLAAAAKLSPQDARFALAYALALDDRGRTDAAMGVLRAEIDKHPFDGDALLALANCYERIGDWKQAMLYAKRVAQLDPANPEVQQLVQRLRARLESPYHSSFSPAR